MALANRIKAWMGVTRNQQLVLGLGLIFLLVHLVDEIVAAHAGLLTDVVAAAAVAGILVFYRSLSPTWCMGLTLLVGIAIKLQLIGEHVVPYFKEGQTEGLITAIVALIGTVLITGVGGGILAETIQSRRARATSPAETG